MSVALLLSLQAAAPPAAAQPVDFDLAQYRRSPPRGCGDAQGADILVCGRRLNQDIEITPEMEKRYGPKGPIKAETDLAEGVVGRVFTESAPMDRGAVSKRALVGVKIAF